MESACPDLEFVRETLEIARQALAAGRRVEALAEGSDDSAIIVAAAAQRELRPGLEALTLSMEMVLAARQAGYRQGEQDGAAEAERRLAEEARPQLRLASARGR
jgi:hypothetical protein